MICVGKFKAFEKGYGNLAYIFIVAIIAPIFPMLIYSTEILIIDIFCPSDPPYPSVLTFDIQVIIGSTILFIFCIFKSIREISGKYFLLIFVEYLVIGVFVFTTFLVPFLLNESSNMWINAAVLIILISLTPYFGFHRLYENFNY
jgi:hypothetical protein